jgi:hypothetical protein
MYMLLEMVTKTFILNQAMISAESVNSISEVLWKECYCYKSALT